LRDYTIVCYDAGYKSLTKTKCWGHLYDVIRSI
jgi:hypothetical protein